MQNIQLLFLITDKYIEGHQPSPNYKTGLWMLVF